MTKPSKPEDRAPLAQSDRVESTEAVARLERFARRVEQATEPSELVTLADEIASFGRSIAHEITRGDDDVHLKRVLLYVPTLQAQSLLRAAEKFDDQGSTRRAAYVLFEALRTAFDPLAIASVAEALSFLLDANDQPVAASRLRDLLGERDQRREAGTKVAELRSWFTAAVEALRDHSVVWTALAETDEQFD